MKSEKTKDIKIWQIACNDSERFLKPTRETIDEMKKSLLGPTGQMHPIAVYQISINKYRLIAGATRFRAASELMWDTIRATVFVGSAVEYDIFQLAENIDRRELSVEVRRDLKAKKKELEKQHLRIVKAAKGGRGKKGGFREEARQLGMPKSTAHDRNREAKPSENDVSRTVSEEGNGGNQKTRTASAHMPQDEFDALDAWAIKHNTNRSDAMRRIIRERIAADTAINIPINILKFPGAS